MAGETVPDPNDGTLLNGQFTSPGGDFVFGVSGWDWGQQRPTSITFFTGCGLDCCTKTEGLACPHQGFAKVCDQHGRPIKGTVSEEGTVVLFNKCSHAQTIAALQAEGIDVLAAINDAGGQCLRCKGTKMFNNKWCPVCYHKASGTSTGLKPMVTCTGWPQLPYDKLKKLKNLPMTPIEELVKIHDQELRRDALKMRKEMEAEHQKALAILME